MLGAKLGLGILLVLGAFLPCEAGSPMRRLMSSVIPRIRKNGCLTQAAFASPTLSSSSSMPARSPRTSMMSFVEGMEIPFTVVTETVTPWVQGWSYGVAHDKDSLEVTALTVEGTEAEVSINMGFVSLDYESVETCGDDPPCDWATGRRAAAGFRPSFTSSSGAAMDSPSSAMQLSGEGYKLLKDVGPDGTLIRFTDRLAYNGSPPTSLSMTVYGKSRLWTTAVDGWVMRNDAPEGLDFLRGDVGLLDGSVLPADGT